MHHNPQGNFTVMDGAGLFGVDTRVDLDDHEREEFESNAAETFRKVWVGTVTFAGQMLTLSMEF